MFLEATTIGVSEADNFVRFNIMVPTPDIGKRVCQYSAWCKPLRE